MSIETLDLVIVGTGPAGAAAALAALSADPTARVALVDRARFPCDKVCGDGLTPAAVTVLDELGVAEVVSDAQLHHRRVRDVTVDGDRVVVDGDCSARCVIGADGANSVVRAALTLPGHLARHTGVALRGYAPAPPAPAHLDIRFVPGRLCPAYGWAFDAGHGRVNVGVGTFDATTRPSRRELSELLAELFGDLVPVPDGLAGHRLPLSSGRPLLGSGRVLLAGDAAGLVDPITGVGIHTALLSGMLAGRAAITDPTRALTAYRHAARMRLGRRLRATCAGRLGGISARSSSTRWSPPAPTTLRLLAPSRSSRSATTA